MRAVLCSEAMNDMFDQLEQINARPRPFEFYTAAELWTDAHTSEQMLAYHLNPDIDVSSRRAAFVDRSVEWIASRFDVGSGTKVADFGCGPGLYTTRLARKRAATTGIDFSTRSIDYARDVAEREGLTVRYEHADYLEFETDARFDLILMIMCFNISCRRTFLKHYSLLTTSRIFTNLKVNSTHTSHQNNQKNKLLKTKKNLFSIIL